MLWRRAEFWFISYLHSGPSKEPPRSKTRVWAADSAL